MVKVEFQTAEGNVVATLQVSGTGIEDVYDPEDVVDFTVLTIGAHTGKRTSFEDDPQEWARSLPRVYRNPYLMAFIADDDNPVARTEQEPIEIADTQLVSALEAMAVASTGVCRP